VGSVFFGRLQFDVDHFFLGNSPIPTIFALTQTKSGLHTPFGVFPNPGQFIGQFDT
jgi:hypothetical protein